MMSLWQESDNNTPSSPAMEVGRLIPARLAPNLKVARESTRAFTCLQGHLGVLEGVPMYTVGMILAMTVLSTLMLCLLAASPVHASDWPVQGADPGMTKY